MYKSHKQRKVPIKAVDLIDAVCKTLVNTRVMAGTTLKMTRDCLFPETILKRKFNLPGI